MENIPGKIKKLLDLREEKRKQKRYDEADQIREQIESQGYIVTDTPQGQHITPKQSDKPVKSFITLFGSGEISSIGRRIHEYVLQRLNKDAPSIVIISTPAGFQPNVHVVEGEIRDFFIEHLPNFHPKVDVLYANNREDANDQVLISILDTADYIFIGPGSPTYVVKNLTDTLLYKKITERLKNGASLSLSSAAVIGFSHFTLPVYEIYKVGSELYWEEGLDLYTKFLHPSLTVIPHFNNNEGGKKTDTSFCYMGAERFKKLQNMLPKKEIIWGIDENTALVFDMQNKSEQVLGLGKVHNLTRTEGR